MLNTRGDFAGAERLFRKALDMRKTLFGDVHPMVAQSLGNLGLVLFELGDATNAEVLLREALATKTKLGIIEHPDVADLLQNLTTVLQARGDLSGARTCAARPGHEEETTAPTAPGPGGFSPRSRHAAARTRRLARGRGEPT